MVNASLNKPIRWQVFPRNIATNDLQRAVIRVFEAESTRIGTPENGLKSNEVLAVVRPRLEELGFQIEGSVKVARPVLYGENDRPSKTYNVDGYHEASGTVLEVEAGQAVENNRFAIDLLKALSIQDANCLVMAIPANYHPDRLKSAGKPPKKEFDEVVKHLDALFSSGRVDLPLATVLVIGY
jgi:hypothetical protein